MPFSPMVEKGCSINCLVAWIWNVNVLQEDDTWC